MGSITLAWMEVAGTLLPAIATGLLPCDATVYF